MQLTRPRAVLVAAALALSGLTACTQDRADEGPSTTTDAGAEPTLPNEPESGDPDPSPGPGSADLEEDGEREDDSLDRD